LLGLGCIYRREFREAELLLGAITSIPFLDSARAAALIPVAQALAEDTATAVANLDWLHAEFTTPTIPVAQVDPVNFRTVAVESLATPFLIEPSLCSLPAYRRFAHEVALRFACARMP
jgi:hypothetical protein